MIEKAESGWRWESGAPRLVPSHDPILTRRADDVSEESLSSPEFRRRCRAMVEAVVAADALGLAAPQVGWNARVFVLRRGLVAVNPVVTPFGLVESEMVEGCLSLPGVSLIVRRSECVRLRASAPLRGWINQAYEGLDARVIQHEVDHLDGVLITHKCRVE